MFCNLYVNHSPLPLERGWGGGFHGILDDVDKHLLEEDGVKMNGDGIVGKMEADTDMSLRTQILEEGAAGLHLFAEVAEL